jgi:enamine deaminase RidA (YjgF/YER057c/UK114 family)
VVPITVFLEPELKHVIEEHTMSRKLISSGSEFESKIGYSRAVADGDYVFVSGTTGYDYETMTMSDDVVEQADQCFKNIEKALLEAGSGLDQVLRVHYIFPNRSDFEPCWPVFKKYLGKACPAATMIVAGLLDDRMKVEIEVTARADSS